jgi:hypothetical protein
MAADCHGCYQPSTRTGLQRYIWGPHQAEASSFTQPFSQQAPSSSLPPFVAFFVSDSLGMRGLVGSASPETVAAKRCLRRP